MVLSNVHLYAFGIGNAGRQHFVLWLRLSGTHLTSTIPADRYYSYLHF